MGEGGRGEERETASEEAGGRVTGAEGRAVWERARGKGEKVRVVWVRARVAQAMEEEGRNQGMVGVVKGEEGEGPERAGSARGAAKVVGGRVGGSWPGEVAAAAGVAAAAPEGQSVAALRRGEGDYYYYMVVTDNEAESDSAAVQCAHATPRQILYYPSHISPILGTANVPPHLLHAPALTCAHVGESLAAVRVLCGPHAPALRDEADAAVIAELLHPIETAGCTGGGLKGGRRRRGRACEGICCT